MLHKVAAEGDGGQPALDVQRCRGGGKRRLLCRSRVGVHSLRWRTADPGPTKWPRRGSAAATLLVKSQGPRDLPLACKLVAAGGHFAGQMPGITHVAQERPAIAVQRCRDGEQRRRLCRSSGGEGSSNCVGQGSGPARIAGRQQAFDLQSCRGGGQRRQLCKSGSGDSRPLAYKIAAAAAAAATLKVRG